MRTEIEQETKVENDMEKAIAEVAIKHNLQAEEIVEYLDRITNDYIDSIDLSSISIEFKQFDK